MALSVDKSLYALNQIVQGEEFVSQLFGIREQEIQNIKQL